VKQSAQQQIKVAALSFGSYTNVNNARAILSLLFFQAGSPITSVAAQGVHSELAGGQQATATGNTGAEAALNFYTQFADPARTVYTWSSSLVNSRNAFVNGDLALYFGYASEEPDIAAGNPNLDFDMARVPQSAGATTRTTYGLAYAFAIPKVSKNQTGALGAAMAFTTSTILPTLASEVGMAPANRTLLASAPAGRFASIYYPEALSAKGWMSPAPTDIDRIFSVMIQNVISGRMAATNALQAADESLNAALSN
jgi:ABC-type glycerol-3-phosphate transport system substrate-binding protein